MSFNRDKDAGAEDSNAVELETFPKATEKTPEKIPEKPDAPKIELPRETTPGKNPSGVTGNEFELDDFARDEADINPQGKTPEKATENITGKKSGASSISPQATSPNKTPEIKSGQVAERKGNINEKRKPKPTSTSQTPQTPTQASLAGKVDEAKNAIKGNNKSKIKSNMPSTPVTQHLSDTHNTATQRQKFSNPQSPTSHRSSLSQAELEIMEGKVKSVLQTIEMLKTQKKQLLIKKNKIGTAPEEKNRIDVKIADLDSKMTTLRQAQTAQEAELAKKQQELGQAKSHPSFAPPTSPISNPVSPVGSSSSTPISPSVSLQENVGIIPHNSKQVSKQVKDQIEDNSMSAPRSQASKQQVLSDVQISLAFQHLLSWDPASLAQALKNEAKARKNLNSDSQSILLSEDQIENLQSMVNGVCEGNVLELEESMRLGDISVQLSLEEKETPIPKMLQTCIEGLNLYYPEGETPVPKFNAFRRFEVVAHLPENEVKEKKEKKGVFSFGGHKKKKEDTGKKVEAPKITILARPDKTEEDVHIIGYKKFTDVQKNQPAEYEPIYASDVWVDGQSIDDHIKEIDNLLVAAKTLPKINEAKQKRSEVLKYLLENGKYRTQLENTFGANNTKDVGVNLYIVSMNLKIEQSQNNERMATERVQAEEKKQALIDAGTYIEIPSSSSSSTSSSSSSKKLTDAELEKQVKPNEKERPTVTSVFPGSSVSPAPSTSTPAAPPSSSSDRPPLTSAPSYSALRSNIDDESFGPLRGRLSSIQNARKRIPSMSGTFGTDTVEDNKEVNNEALEQLIGDLKEMKDEIKQSVDEVVLHEVEGELNSLMGAIPKEPESERLKKLLEANLQEVTTALAKIKKTPEEENEEDFEAGDSYASGEDSEEESEEASEEEQLDLSTEELQKQIQEKNKRIELAKEAAEASKLAAEAAEKAAEAKKAETEALEKETKETEAQTKALEAKQAAELAINAMKEKQEKIDEQLKGLKKTEDEFGPLLKGYQDSNAEIEAFKGKVPDDQYDVLTKAGLDDAKAQVNKAQAEIMKAKGILKPVSLFEEARPLLAIDEMAVLNSDAFLEPLKQVLKDMESSLGHLKAEKENYQGQLKGQIKTTLDEVSDLLNKVQDEISNQDEVKQGLEETVKEKDSDDSNKSHAAILADAKLELVKQLMKGLELKQKEATTLQDILQTWIQSHSDHTKPEVERVVGIYTALSTDYQSLLPAHDLKMQNKQDEHNEEIDEQGARLASLNNLRVALDNSEVGRANLNALKQNFTNAGVDDAGALAPIDELKQAVDAFSKKIEEAQAKYNTLSIPGVHPTQPQLDNLNGNYDVLTKTLALVEKLNTLAAGQHDQAVKDAAAGVKDNLVDAMKVSITDIAAAFPDAQGSADKIGKASEQIVAFNALLGEGDDKHDAIKANDKAKAAVEKIVADIKTQLGTDDLAELDDVKQAERQAHIDKIKLAAELIAEIKTEAAKPGTNPKVKARLGGIQTELEAKLDAANFAGIDEADTHDQLATLKNHQAELKKLSDALVANPAPVYKEAIEAFKKEIEAKVASDSFANLERDLPQRQVRVTTLIANATLHKTALGKVTTLNTKLDAIKAEVERELTARKQLPAGDPNRNAIPDLETKQSEIKTLQAQLKFIENHEFEAAQLADINRLVFDPKQADGTDANNPLNWTDAHKGTFTDLKNTVNGIAEKAIPTSQDVEDLLKGVKDFQKQIADDKKEYQKIFDGLPSGLQGKVKHGVAPKSWNDAFTKSLAPTKSRKIKTQLKKIKELSEEIKALQKDRAATPPELEKLREDLKLYQGRLERSKQEYQAKKKKAIDTYSYDQLAPLAQDIRDLFKSKLESEAEYKSLDKMLTTLVRLLSFPTSDPVQIKKTFDDWMNSPNGHLDRLLRYLNRDPETRAARPWDSANYMLDKTKVPISGNTDAARAFLEKLEKLFLIHAIQKTHTQQALYADDARMQKVNPDDYEAGMQKSIDTMKQMLGLVAPGGIAPDASIIVPGARIQASDRVDANNFRVTTHDLSMGHKVGMVEAYDAKEKALKINVYNLPDRCDPSKVWKSLLIQPADEQAKALINEFILKATSAIAKNYYQERKTFEASNTAKTINALKVLVEEFKNKGLFQGVALCYDVKGNLKESDEIAKTLFAYYSNKANGLMQEIDGKKFPCDDLIRTAMLMIIEAKTAESSVLPPRVKNVNSPELEAAIQMVSKATGVHVISRVYDLPPGYLKDEKRFATFAKYLADPNKSWSREYQDLKTFNPDAQKIRDVQEGKEGQKTLKPLL